MDSDDDAPFGGGQKDPSFPTILDTLRVDDNPRTAGKKAAPKKGWAALGLNKQILQALRKKGYSKPTPIQKKAIPVVVKGDDIVAMARTGSGKTAAFLLPIIQRLHAHSPRVGSRAVVLSPTRELATQTYGFFRQFSKFTDLRSTLLVGGESLEFQFSELARNPDIMIATPGRLLHLMLEVGWNLSRVEMLVFDEADRLFEMGFEDQMREILAKITHSSSMPRQTMLFSATLPTKVAEFAKAGLANPEVIRLDSETTLSPLLKLAFFNVKTHERLSALIYLLLNVVRPEEPTLVFAATHHHVEFLQQLLAALHIRSVALYGKLDPEARKIAVKDFKKGRCNIMVVTDVAARGVDIPLLDNVINFDFPPKEKLFVHRVGRVARAGRPGTAYSLVSKDELAYVIDLHMFLGRPLRTIEDYKQALQSDPQASADDGYIGRIPQSLIEDLGESCERLVHYDPLQSAHQTMTNSILAYRRTRSDPSSESVRRAKAQTCDQMLHPAFYQASGTSSLVEDEASRSNFLDSISKYRPLETIMEIQARAKGKGENRLVMRQKRAAHDKLLTRNKLTQQLEDDPNANLDGNPASLEASSALDRIPAFGPLKTKVYMSAAEKRKHKKEGAPLSSAVAKLREEESLNPAKKQRTLTGSKHSAAAAVVEPMFAEKSEASFQKDAQVSALSLDDRKRGRERIEDVILDIVPEDTQDILKQQRNLRWDAKKKRFVQTYGNKSGDKRFGRDESGRKIDLTANKFVPKRYEAWKEKTKTHIPLEGATERDSRRRSDKDNIPLNRRASWHTGGKAAAAAASSSGRRSEVVTKDMMRHKLKMQEKNKLKQRPELRKKAADQKRRERQRKIAALRKPKGYSKSVMIVRKNLPKSRK